MEAQSQTLQIGSQLKEYTIQHVFPPGGFGITYKAWDNDMARPVAIKEFLPAELAVRDQSSSRVHARDTSQADEFAYGLQKFKEEAQTLARFDHPNIVKAYRFFEENGTGYMVMQYADGQSLDELIKAGGAISEENIKAHFLPLLDGLAEVHRAGLLHRDIKPANIYIRDNGSSLLIDFGAARQAVGQHSKSVTGIVSQGYAPTEQYGTNAKKQGPWTDIYAIGATLYKCITGETPVDAPTRRDDIHDDETDPLIPAVEVGEGRYSEPLLRAIDRCLEVAIKQRPQSVVDLKALISGKGNTQKASQPQSDRATRRVTDDEAGFFEKGDQKQDQFSTAKKAGIAAGLIALLGTGLWLIPGSDKPNQDREGVTQQNPQAQAILERAQQQAAQAPSSAQPEESEPAGVTEPSPPQEPVTNQLWVNTTPSNARVILPDEPAHVRYYGGIELAPESHRIKVTANGYYPQSLQANLTYGDQTLNVALKAKPQRLPFEPEMVSIPGGSFMMGSNDGDSDEKPVHQVNIKPFKLGKYEVTWAQYQTCIDEGTCPNNDGDGRDNGWGKGNRPVINVSWTDITKHYIPWLNRKTGKRYRLPTEAEWEYAARAGSTSKYSWGNDIGRNKANCDGCGSQWDKSKAAPVGSFRANAFGLYNMHGNVWEWVQDCWNGSYQGAPSNGSAWISGYCVTRVLRGGSWLHKPNDLRSASRDWTTATTRFPYFGFRLALDL